MNEDRQDLDKKEYFYACYNTVLHYTELTTVLCVPVDTPCAHSSELLVGFRAGHDYKEGDIKFLEFCGAAWSASRDGGLLQLLWRGTGGHST